MDILLVCVLILCFVFNVSTEFYITDAQVGMTWHNANKNCSLASPNLIYTQNGIEIDTKLQGTTLTENDTIWLGYVQTFQMFQYLGCVEANEINSFTKRFVEVSSLDPGLCYSACNKMTVFGIEDNNNVTKCYCIDQQWNSPDGITDTHVNCTSKCTFSANTACGGNQFVSLYKHVNRINVGNQTTDGLCCFYEPVMNKFEWANCSLAYGIMCQSDSMLPANVFNNTFKPWFDVGTVCFQKSQYPVSLKNLTLNQVVKHELWTGILRSRVIFNSKDSSVRDIANVTSGPFGYLMKEKGHFHVYFTSNMSTSTSKFLCDYENENSNPSTLTGTSHEATSQKNENSNPSTLTGMSHEATSQVGVYIGVSIAVIVIIAISVVTFIMLRKRRYKAMRQNGNKEIKGYSNTAYNDAIDVHSSPHLSKHTVTLNESSAYDLIESIPGNRDEDDDAYNTTFTSGKCVVLKETENVYNRLETVTEDTYNHVNMNTSKLTTSSNKTAENTYSPDHVIDAEDDYSHINVSSNNKSDTDNVYSKANFVKTGSAENHGGDDTDITYNMAGQNANRVV